MINKVLRTRFKAALILSTLLIVAASLVIFGYQGQATSAFPYETIKNSRFGGGGYVEEYIEPTAEGEDGHFGVDGLSAWRPPVDDLSGTPLQELEEYLEWESAQLAEAGITWNRTLVPAAWPFSWHAIEKTEGDYDFERADLLVKAAQNQNLSLLGMVAPFTPWDSPDCTETEYRKPNDMDAYKTFMTKLVERYDGDGIDDMPGLKYGIKYWEISNEPDIKFIDGVSGYLETHKAGYEAIKAADPDAKVLNGGTCPVYDPATSELAQDILDFWDSFFAAGGGDYIDIFNIHYTSPEPAPPLKDFLNQWNTLLNKYSLEKDIWVTETSTYSGSLERWGTTYPTQTEEEQAGWWVKHACYGLAHGVTKLFWAVFYEEANPMPLDEQQWQLLASMINSDKTPKLIYTTQQILSSKIDDFSSVQELAEGQYKFIVDDKPIYVLWGDGTVPAEIEDQIIVTDIYGNEQVMDAAELGLTDNPVFVETEEADILSYYRSYSGDPNVVDTEDLLKAADDWASEVTPPGFTDPITTQQLLQLADEWAAG